MDYTGKEPISDVLKFRLGQYDYIGSTAGDGSAFYAGDSNHPNFLPAYIFKDWETPNTWLGTVIYAYSIVQIAVQLLEIFGLSFISISSNKNLN